MQFPTPTPVFTLIPTINARRGYKRCSLPGVGTTLGRGRTATTDFWRDKSGKFVIRFASQGYVYCYECVLQSGKPIGDKYIKGVFADFIGELLVLWMVEGCDYDPIYYVD